MDPSPNTMLIYMERILYTAFHHCNSTIPLMDRFLVPWISISSDAIQTELKPTASAQASANCKDPAKDDVCYGECKPHWLSWGLVNAGLVLMMCIP